LLLLGEGRPHERHIFEETHVASEDQHNDNSAAPPSLSKRGVARRRLAKAGVGAAGVLWTLESQAAMTPLLCKSPSGALSGGLNSHYGPAPTCNGPSPGYWKTHDGWPCARDTRFAAVFHVPGDMNSCEPNKAATSYLCATFGDLISPQSYDTYNLAMHVVATYLNILSGRISFLSVETLKNMWYEVATTNRYSPTANVYWTPEQVKRYLRATQG
jgi:hypothetical protein